MTVEVSKTFFISLFIFYILMAGRWTVGSEPVVTVTMLILSSVRARFVCVLLRNILRCWCAPLDWHNAILIIVKWRHQGVVLHSARPVGVRIKLWSRVTVLQSCHLNLQTLNPMKSIPGCAVNKALGWCWRCVCACVCRCLCL